MAVEEAYVDHLCVDDTVSFLRGYENGTNFIKEFELQKVLWSRSEFWQIVTY